MPSYFCIYLSFLITIADTTVNASDTGRASTGRLSSIKTFLGFKHTQPKTFAYTQQEIILGEETLIVLQSTFIPPIARIIFEYTGHCEKGKFIAYFDPDKSLYTKSGQSQIAPIFRLYGIQNGYLPYVRTTYFTAFPIGSDLQEVQDLSSFPELWDHPQINLDLQDSLPQSSLHTFKTYLSHGTPAPFHKDTGSMISLLSRLTISIHPINSEAVHIGQKNSTLYLLPSISFRAFAQIYKNFFIFLKSEYDKNPDTKVFKDTPHLHAFIEAYHKNAEAIETLIADRSCSLAPVFSPPRLSLKKCIERTKKDLAKIT